MLRLQQKYRHPYRFRRTGALNKEDKDRVFNYLIVKKNTVKIRPFKTCYEFVWDLFPQDLQEFRCAFRIMDTRTVPSMKIDTSYKHDFDDIILKVTYLYLYFTINIHSVKDLLSRFHIQSQNECFNLITQSKSLNIVCLGGGSGCEIFGIIEWLKAIDVKMKLNCNIVDMYKWRWLTENLMNLMDPFDIYNLSETSFSVFNFNDLRPYYRINDAHKNESDKLKKDKTMRPFLIEDYLTEDILMKDFINADIITVVNFIRCFDSNDLLFRFHFMSLLKQMKSSALLFFMDKADSSYMEIVRFIASGSGLEQIAEEMDMNCALPEQELKATRKLRFSDLPETSMDICGSLWRKP